MLVETGSVESLQSVRVAGEVGGNPVDQHPDPMPMAVVDEIHEIVGRAKAAGGGEVAGGLVTPRPVERIFCDGQQLQVGVAHLSGVVDQHVGQFAIVEERPAIAWTPP
jgi:hypothetical protein